MIPRIAAPAVEAFRRDLLAEHRDLVKVVQHPRENWVILNYTDACATARRWDEVTRICRGLIVDAGTGEVLALPFPKFFNLGEVETQPERLPREPFTVFEKVDGALGILYRERDGRPALATRGSFCESPVASRGTAMLRRLERIGDVPPDFTLLFEIVFPALPGNVVDYGKLEELVLLAAYNRRTGEELGRGEVVRWAAHLAVRTPRVLELRSLEALLEARAAFPRDLEGVVIRFESGLRVKLKGEAYLELLRAKKGFSRNALSLALEEGRESAFLLGLPEELRPEAAAFLEELRREAGAFEADARRHFARAPAGGDRRDFARWVSAEVPPAYRAALFLFLDGKEPNWPLLARRARERKSER
ncbi:MAG: hypothetical protein HY721_31330 [Planctomycetes bacterium]|nr:hypothetical protein [Planctomycetota bacterium]